MPDLIRVHVLLVEEMIGELREGFFQALARVRFIHFACLAIGLLVHPCLRVCSRTCSK